MEQVAVIIVLLLLLVVVYISPQYMGACIVAAGTTLGIIAYNEFISTTPKVGGGWVCHDKSRPFGQRCVEDPNNSRSKSTCETICKTDLEYAPTAEGLLEMYKQAYRFPIPEAFLKQIVDGTLAKEYHTYTRKNLRMVALQNLKFYENVQKTAVGDTPYVGMHSFTPTTNIEILTKLAAETDPKYKTMVMLLKYYINIHAKHGTVLLPNYFVLLDICKRLGDKKEEENYLAKINDLYLLFNNIGLKWCVFAVPGHANAVFVDANRRVVTRLETNYGVEVVEHFAADIQNLFEPLNYSYMSTVDSAMYGLQNYDIRGLGRCVAWSYFIGTTMALNYENRPYYEDALSGILGKAGESWKLLDLYLFYIYKIPPQLTDSSAVLINTKDALDKFNKVASTLDTLKLNTDDEYIKSDILYYLRNWIVGYGDDYLDAFQADPNNIDPLDAHYWKGVSEMIPKFNYYISRVNDADFTPEQLDIMIMADMSTLFNVEKLGTSFHRERAYVSRETGCAIC